MFRLATENKDDWWEVEALYDLTFAPGREALSSYRLREGVRPVADLCLTVRDAYEALAGVIRYWPVVVGDGQHACLLLGPVAVHPTHQGEGLGAFLMRESLALAKDTGWGRVLLVGDAPYYQRFGFEAAPSLDFPKPVNPDRILSLELVEGAFDGVFGEVGKVH
ncbi:MAG: N-acetyltransferase [Amylibacter sp.]|nr:N-acetyltransferase [Amylibacter sp.]